MILVGMMSTYKEGALVRAAIRSILDADLDALYVFEGPAGEPLGDEVPESELVFPDTDDRIIVHRGRWRTDGRKRNEILQRIKRDYPGEQVWAIVVDGDEVLRNGEYLRDQLQALVWNDEQKHADASDPENAPWARWPLRLVESDGTIALITARCFRCDLLRSIDISSSVVTNTHGVQDGWGNYQETSKVWLEGWLHAIDKGQMIAWPPLPCEPFLVHRANLRHPLRRGLRMHEQETRELARARRDAGLE